MFRNTSCKWFIYSAFIIFRHIFFSYGLVYSILFYTRILNGLFLWDFKTLAE